MLFVTFVEARVGPVHNLAMGLSSKESPCQRGHNRAAVRHPPLALGGAPREPPRPYRAPPLRSRSYQRCN